MLNFRQSFITAQWDFKVSPQANPGSKKHEDGTLRVMLFYFISGAAIQQISPSGAPSKSRLEQESVKVVRTHTPNAFCAEKVMKVLHAIQLRARRPPR